MAEAIITAAQHLVLRTATFAVPVLFVFTTGASLAVAAEAPDVEWLEPPPVSASTRTRQASAPLAEQFAALTAQWLEETTTPSSDFTSVIMNSAYQRIIGLGPPVVPFILAELARAPDHWGWALEAITGEAPVPPQAAGDVDAIAAAWLEWGRAHGLAS